jgi:excisionase family DNA binding protein
MYSKTRYGWCTVVGDTTPYDRLLLPVSEAGAVLGVGRTMAWRLVQSGELASVRIGKRRLVPRVALEQFIESLRAGAEAGRSTTR